MKRVIIVPVTETRQFPGMEILACGGSIAALVGDNDKRRRVLAPCERTETLIAGAEPT
jgi:hypothetical protein